MLNRKSIFQAERIASVLAEEGIVINTIQGTPLDFITSAMAGVIMEDDSDIVDAVQEMSISRAGIDKHNVQTEEYVTLIGKKISGLHNFVRNVINPLIKSIVTEFESQRAELENQPLIPLTIVPIRENAIHGDWKLGEILSPWVPDRYTDGINLSNELFEKIQSFVTPDSFSVCAKSGSEALDEFVSGTVKRERFLSSEWHRARKQVSFVDSFLCDDDICDLLFIRGLLNGRLPDFPVESLTDEDRSSLIGAMRFKGQRVIDRLTLINDHYETKDADDFFVFSDDGKLYVHLDEYSDWINNGGSIEAIMGAVSQSGLSRSAVITAVNNTSASLSLYEAIKSNRQAVDGAKICGLVETVSGVVITNWINGKEEFGLEERGLLHDKLAKSIVDKPYRLSMDVHEWVRELACACTTNSKLAYDLLSTMEGYMSMNEETTVEDAAIYGTSFILARWIAEQLVPTKVKKTLFGSPITAQ